MENVGLHKMIIFTAKFENGSLLDQEKQIIMLVLGLVYLQTVY